MERISPEDARIKGSQPPPDIISLERHSWRNWFLLATISILTTAGLVTAIPPLLDERIVDPWPWVKTDLVLLVGLSLLVMAFIGYLTQQQRRVSNVLKHLQQLREERADHIHQNSVRAYALLNVSHIMGSETDLQSIFDTITKMCVEAFICRRASLMLVDKDTQELVVRSVSGTATKDIIDMRQKIGEGIAGWVATHRKALFLGGPSDLDKYPELKGIDPSLRSAMVVPIMLRDDVVGVLNVSTDMADIKYDMDDLKALQVFAGNAGACIRHREHADWLRCMIDKMREKSPSGENMSKEHNIIEMTSTRGGLCHKYDFSD
ncbi:MAG: GAF domain-containing protein [Candidatus Krumholzibacteriota bacterium]|nr:GAF domain-containing protein [Candidatus Krumholzibacteriota bacterium]